MSEERPVRVGIKLFALAGISVLALMLFALFDQRGWTPGTRVTMYIIVGTIGLIGVSFFAVGGRIFAGFMLIGTWGFAYLLLSDGVHPIAVLCAATGWSLILIHMILGRRAPTALRSLVEIGESEKEPDSQMPAETSPRPSLPFVQSLIFPSLYMLPKPWRRVFAIVVGVLCLGIGGYLFTFSLVHAFQDPRLLGYVVGWVLPGMGLVFISGGLILLFSR